MLFLALKYILSLKIYSDLNVFCTWFLVSAFIKHDSNKLSPKFIESIFSLEEFQHFLHNFICKRFLSDEKVYEFGCKNISEPTRITLRLNILVTYKNFYFTTCNHDQSMSIFLVSSKKEKIPLLMNEELSL